MHWSVANVFWYYSSMCVCVYIYKCVQTSKVKLLRENECFALLLAGVIKCDEYANSGFIFCFSSLKGLPLHILVRNELDHVQSHHLLLSKPKVKLTFPLLLRGTSLHLSKVPPTLAGSVLVSAMPFLGVPSSKCQRRIRWSCSTHTPSEWPWHTAYAKPTHAPPFMQSTQVMQIENKGCVQGWWRVITAVINRGTKSTWAWMGRRSCLRSHRYKRGRHHAFLWKQRTCMLQWCFWIVFSNRMICCCWPTLRAVSFSFTLPVVFQCILLLNPFEPFRYAKVGVIALSYWSMEVPYGTFIIGSA